MSAQRRPSPAWRPRLVGDAPPPPNTAPEAEQAIARAVLQGAPLGELRGLLEPEHFERESLSEVYRAGCALDAEGRARSVELVAGALRARGTLERMGDTAALWELAEDPATMEALSVLWTEGPEGGKAMRRPLVDLAHDVRAAAEEREADRWAEARLRRRGLELYRPGSPAAPGEELPAGGLPLTGLSGGECRAWPTRGGDPGRIVRVRTGAAELAVCPRVVEDAAALDGADEVSCHWLTLEVPGYGLQEASTDGKAGGLDSLWDRCPVPGSQSRHGRDLLGEAIRAQLPHLPLESRTRAVSRSGWHRDGEGRLAYLDLAGRRVWGEGQVTYRAPDAELVEWAAQAPVADRDAICLALAELVALGRSTGIPLLLLGGGLRSLGYSFRAPAGGVALQGESGVGKTTLAGIARMLWGRPPEGAEPRATATFRDTLRGWEVPLDREGDMSPLVDDLHPQVDPRDAEARLSQLFRSVASAGAIRQRMTRQGGAAVSHRVRGVPIVTAEELPPALAASTLRRAIVFRLRPGQVPVREALDGSSGERAVDRWWVALRTLGELVIAYLGRLGASPAGELLRDLDTEATRSLGTELGSRWEREVSAKAGPLLAGLALAERALSLEKGSLVADVWRPLLDHIRAQAELLSGAEELALDPGLAIGRVIREALAESRALVVDEHGRSYPSTGAAVRTLAEVAELLDRRPQELGYPVGGEGVVIGPLRGGACPLRLLDTHTLGVESAHLWGLLHPPHPIAAPAGLLGCPPTHLSRVLDREGVSLPGVRAAHTGRRLIRLPLGLVWPEEPDEEDAPPPPPPEAAPTPLASTPPPPAPEAPEPEPEREDPDETLPPAATSHPLLQGTSKARVCPKCQGVSWEPGPGGYPERKCSTCGAVWTPADLAPWPSTPRPPQTREAEAAPRSGQDRGLDRVAVLAGGGVLLGADGAELGRYSLDAGGFRAALQRSAQLHDAGSLWTAYMGRDAAEQFQLQALTLDGKPHPLLRELGGPVEVGQYGDRFLLGNVPRHRLAVQVPSLAPEGEHASPWAQLDGRELLDGLQDFRQHMGTGWQGSAVETVRLMARHARVHLDLEGGMVPPPPAMEKAPKASHTFSMPPPPMWARTELSEEERSRAWVLGWDSTRAHNAAIGRALVGLGPWRHLSPAEGRVLAEQSHLRAGLLQVRLRERCKPWEVPHWQLSTGEAVWVPTATVEYLRKRFGAERVEVLDGYGYEHTSRYLRPLAERIERGYQASTGAVRAAIKGLYPTLAGGFASHRLASKPEASMYRPDLRDTILATSYAGLWYALDRARKRSGAWPVAVNVDAVLYAVDSPEHQVAADALGLRTGADRLGYLKPEGRAVRMADYLEALAAKRPVWELLREGS